MTNFNEIITKQLENAVASDAIQSKIILKDKGYELQIVLFKIDEHEDNEDE